MPPGRQQRLGRPHGQLVHARPARAPASAKAGRTAHAARPSVLEPPDAPPGQSSSRFVMQLERGAATVTSDALHGTLGVCEGLLNLARRGLYLHKGTVVDATISKAPSAMTGSFRMRLCSPRVCRCRAALGRATTPHRSSSREALCLLSAGLRHHTVSAAGRLCASSRAVLVWAFCRERSTPDCSGRRIHVEVSLLGAGIASAGGLWRIPLE